VPDPLAFESEYLSVLSGEAVTSVRPEPTVTIAFDGERCSVEPAPVGVGDQVVEYVDPTGQTDGGLLIGLNEMTYRELRDFTGPDGSIVPPSEAPLEGIEQVAFVQGLTEATVPDLTLVAVCVQETDDSGAARVWLSDPVPVGA